MILHILNIAHVLLLPIGVIYKKYEQIGPGKSPVNFEIIAGTGMKIGESKTQSALQQFVTIEREWKKLKLRKTFLNLSGFDATKLEPCDTNLSNYSPKSHKMYL